MPIVSDADIIIHLSKLDKLFMLEFLYKEIAISEYVKNELLDKKFKENNNIEEAIKTFVKVYPVSEQIASQIAKYHKIHIGEVHVKALGEKLKSNYFLSNERKVRNAAKEEGFKVVGTIGVILKANKQGIIKKIRINGFVRNDERSRI